MISYHGLSSCHLVTLSPCYFVTLSFSSIFIKDCSISRFRSRVLGVGGFCRLENLWLFEVLWGTDIFQLLVIPSEARNLAFEARFLASLGMTNSCDPTIPQRAKLIWIAIKQAFHSVIELLCCHLFLSANLDKLLRRLNRNGCITTISVSPDIFRKGFI